MIKYIDYTSRDKITKSFQKTKKIYHKLENRSYVVQNSQKSDLGMEKEF